VDAILDGLSEDYDGFITSILSHTYPYNVDELEALLLAQKEWFEKHRLAQSFVFQVNTTSTTWHFNNPVKQKPSHNNFRDGCLPIALVFPFSQSLCWV